MNFYQRYPSDYISKTMHLSLAEDGAYNRLLDWMYANERAIPHQKRYEIARGNGSKDRKVVDSVLKEFFVRNGDVWMHERVSKEIERAEPKLRAARTNGRKGGRPPKNPPGSETEPTGYSGNNPSGSEKKPTGFCTETHAGSGSGYGARASLSGKELPYAAAVGGGRS